MSLVSGFLFNERLEQLTKGFEIYQLLTSIDDKDLQNEVVRVARSLSSGEIPPILAELRNRTVIHKIRESLWASDYHPNTRALLDFWEGGMGRSWYAENLEAVKKGIKIERHFLLQRHEVVKEDGTWDPKVMQLLQKQTSDKIQVRVLWLEEATKGVRKPTRDIICDFVIFDREEVTSSTEYETKMYRRPSNKVSSYIEIFREQKIFSHGLEEVLPESRPR